MDILHRDIWCPIKMERLKSMDILHRDIWSLIGEADIICITTNGFVKKDGRAVMGRGCAKEAKDRYPDIDLLLGECLKNGNHVYELRRDGNTSIYSFPVKPVSGIFDKNNVVNHMASKFSPGQTVPGWAMKADIDVIRQSAVELRDRALMLNAKLVAIPKPGCGAGELRWEDVERVLDSVFDGDPRFVCVDKPKPNGVM